MWGRLALLLFACWGAAAQAASPTVDSTPATGNFTGATSGTVTLTTTGAGTIVVDGMFENTSGSPVSVSSVTATGLTFTKRAAVSGTINQSGGVGSCVGDLEEWWADSSAAVTSKVITVTVSASVDGGSLIAYQANGTLRSAPWDSNAGLPAYVTHTSGSVGPNGTASTTENNSMIVGTYGECANATHGNGTGYTNIQTKQDGNANWCKIQNESQGFTTTQTNKTVDFTTGTGAWFFISDALTADAAPVAAGRILNSFP